VPKKTARPHACLKMNSSRSVQQPTLT